MATVHTFEYTIQDLIDRINREVLYKTGNRNDKPGMGNNSTVDADTLIEDYIHTISADLFDKWISALGRGLIDLETPVLGYEYGIGNPRELIFRIIEPEKFDTGTLPSILMSIEDVIVSYCVWQWLMDKNLKGWEKYEYEHERKYSNLKMMTTRRTKINIKYKYQ